MTPKVAKFHLLGLATFALLSGLHAAAEPYVVPASPRTDTSLDAGWRFIRQDVAGAQTNGFDDSAWTVLDLPHTWNNLDGQDGGNDYYRGIGWYRLHYAVSTNAAGRRLFLKFDGANIVSDLYVNGSFVGEHQGGFAAFVFDATPYLNVGADNLIAVKVNNAYNANVPPLSADFTLFGGIYRDVHLLTTDPVQVSPLDYGSPGVYLKTTGVSSNSANLQVTTVVSNAAAGVADVTVRAVVTDATSNIITTLTNVLTLPAASLSNVVATATMSHPHLWNGLADPYLYQTFVEIYSGTNLVDLVSQPLGFRSFRVDPTNGFFLNGASYDLHGVAMHQDWLNCGWALNNAQRETNFMFLKELGVTAVRLAHYQHHEYTYQLADRNGIILWSEVPLVNTTTETPAFYNNAKQQLRELIRQNYNHPSVVCWGMYNELSLNVNTGPTNLVNQLVQLEAQEDPTRPSTGATLASNGDANSWYPQLIGFNEYYGWYESPLNYLGAWADNIHAAHPTNCIGISENGAGASVYQHSEDPVAWPATGGLYHPEEWQNLVHETNWAALKARPFIWCKFLWNMFNFAVDSRNEGDTPGRNDKGLVTYDRLVRKDSFYFYKANWTTNPMVYITGHTFTNRTIGITAKVYANCDSVELFVNGVSHGVATSANCVFTWPVTLQAGDNLVSAIGTKGGVQVNDSLVWIGVPPPVSQGRAAAASSYQTGNEPVNGNDGVSSTRWAASGAAFPQWWRVDLAAVQPITKAVISWYSSAARTYQYRIEISTNDVTYSTLIDNTANTAGGDTTDTFAAYARYVRITVTGVVPAGGWASFYECQIFGPPSLVVARIPGGVRLSWPPNSGSWRLQFQTNSPARGLGTNWLDVPGSPATNQLDLPVVSATPAAFYRLVAP
jgi:beta-galactosidase